MTGVAHSVREVWLSEAFLTTGVAHYFDRGHSVRDVRLSKAFLMTGVAHSVELGHSVRETRLFEASLDDRRRANYFEGGHSV